jgi:integrase
MLDVLSSTSISICTHRWDTAGTRAAQPATPAAAAFFLAAAQEGWLQPAAQPLSQPGHHRDTRLAEGQWMRKVRSAKLETRSARLRLAVRRKPYFVKLARGAALGYRRTKTAGTWVVRVTTSGQDWTERLAIADDCADADGRDILTYDDAQAKAWQVAGAGKPTVGNTVKAALDRYEDDLRARGLDTRNVTRVRFHLSEKLAGNVVAKVPTEDLTRFRDELAAKMKPASIDRTMRALKAALNLAADGDERIARRPWKTALKTVSGASEARNVILDDNDVRTIIAAAYRDSDEFGELVELMAVTGARSSQLVRLRGEDVQADWLDMKTRKRQPRVMMPASRKGRGVKKITHRPVPITEALAKRLKGRTGVLLKRMVGKPWAKLNLSHHFEKATKDVEFNNSSRVTLYALRHTSIVRQLLANVPIRVVAALHDTSAAMIEQNYSKHIADHSDDLARPTLPETSAEVIPLRAAVAE